MELFVFFYILAGVKKLWLAVFYTSYIPIRENMVARLYIRAWRCVIAQIFVSVGSVISFFVFTERSKVDKLYRFHTSGDLRSHKHEHYTSRRSASDASADPGIHPYF